MNPGVRIKLIKETAKELVKLEWSDIDLTLRTFGLGWSDQWDGEDKYGYCQHFIEQGNDNQLAQLHAYLTSDNAADSSQNIIESSEPWQPRRFKLFLSHISQEKKFIKEIKIELEKFGINGFLAHEDIQPTKEWQGEIEKALSTCDGLAAFLAPGFHASKWTDQEVGMAISRRVPVIPIMQGETPYGFMGKYQGLDCRKLSAPDITEKLFELIAKNPLTSTLITENLVNKFEESMTYDEANSTSRLLRRLTSWSPENIRRIETAKDKNSQVAGGWSVPDNIAAIVAEQKSPKF